MAYEMRVGQGSAFKNDKKTEDWHPAYKGKVMLPDGSVHWLDINPKKTASGDTWIAVKIGNPVANQMTPVSSHSAAKANAFVEQPDDDIPF